MTDLLKRVASFSTAPILSEHLRALPQVDQLCGPFWARLAMLVDGRLPEQLPSEIQTALVAGTQVCPILDEKVRPVAEPAHRAGWEKLPHTTVAARAGTSARGLGAAIRELSAGRLVALPLSGTWHPDQLEHLMSALSDSSTVAIANIATSALWGSQPSALALSTFLAPQANTSTTGILHQSKPRRLLTSQRSAGTHGKAVGPPSDNKHISLRGGRPIEIAGTLS